MGIGPNPSARDTETMHIVRQAIRTKVIMVFFILIIMILLLMRPAIQYVRYGVLWNIRTIYMFEALTILFITSHG